ncbi:MAG: winged helix-turn-helix domain-containing protein [Flavobacteriales bacterium]
MINRLALFLLLALLNSTCFADGDTLSQKEKQHLEVSMRMVGHQILLSLGDSTSRVLPVKKNAENQYQIQFENEFAFHPESIALIIDSVIAATNVAEHYIVRFETCEKGRVVHSYEITPIPAEDVLACGTRIQPSDCYSIVITIFQWGDPIVFVNNRDLEAAENDSLLGWIVGGSAIFLLLALFVVWKRKRVVSEPDPAIISIGEYLFNKRKMELSFKGESIELTSKECDLLQLLCDSTNDTVERETILKMVWGDEGDYVGRTLDVFISKLRKKLEGDSNIKIANIRGVGYKLVVDV